MKIGGAEYLLSLISIVYDKYHLKQFDMEFDIIFDIMGKLEDKTESWVDINIPNIERLEYGINRHPSYGPNFMSFDKDNRILHINDMNDARRIALSNYFFDETSIQFKELQRLVDNYKKPILIERTEEETNSGYIYAPFVIGTENVPLVTDTTLKNVCPDEIPDKGPSAPIFIHRKDIPATFSNPYVCELHSQLNNLSDNELYDMYSKMMVHIYHRTHKCCPKCGSKTLSMTLLGFPAMTHGVSLDYRIKNFHYADNNSVKCQDCGWTGVVDDLKE